MFCALHLLCCIPLQSKTKHNTLTAGSREGAETGDRAKLTAIRALLSSLEPRDLEDLKHRRSIVEMLASISD